MKTMTCKQLGGACDKKFHANSFDEIAGMSKQHGMEMFQKKDAAHPQTMHECNRDEKCGDGGKGENVTNAMFKSHEQMKNEIK